MENFAKFPAKYELITFINNTNEYSKKFQFLSIINYFFKFDYSKKRS